MRDNRQHLKDRALERYGVELSDGYFGTIYLMIAAAPLLARSPDGGETRLVKVRGVVLKAVYYPARERIATFLPATSHALAAKRMGPPREAPGSYFSDGRA